MIICNSSPLISLGNLGRIDILHKLYGKVFIPDEVYQETVLQATNELQKQSILDGIENGTIEVVTPNLKYDFRRKLDFGEKGVLNLALENEPDAIILDDSKARKEAKELGFGQKVIFTSTILKLAEDQGIIEAYSKFKQELEKLKIFLPE